jgi:hypothetical protein
MPVHFVGQFTKTKTRAARGRGFDAAISRLAPTIAKLQCEGHLGIIQIAAQLNLLGIKAPSGQSFTYTTTRRVLRRLAALGLAKGPLTSTESRRHGERTCAPR